METIHNVKDQVVGGAKSAVGAMTGNEEWQKEGEQQKQQAKDSANANPQEEFMKDVPAEVGLDIHMKKGKVFEEMGSKTNSKEMTNDGKQMQKEASSAKEWQGTHDKISGLATGKEDIKQEGHFQREKGESTQKKDQKEESDSSQQSSIMDTLYTVKDKVVEGAKSAIGSLTGNEDLKNEGEKQRDPTHDSDFKSDDSKEKFAGRTKETFGSATGKDDLKREGEYQKRRSEDTKKGHQDDQDSSQHSSVKETLSSVKDKVVGGAKSAVGAMTGNEEWQKEGEQQKQQGKEGDTSSLPGEVSADIHFQKGKVFEEMGSKTKSKDMTNEGKHMQKEASAVKEWQDTQDILAGRSATTFKDEKKKEGDFQREKHQDTSKEHEDKKKEHEDPKKEHGDKKTEHETEPSHQSSIMETLYTVKEKIVEGAMSAIDALTGHDDSKKEGEGQKDFPHDAHSTPQKKEGHFQRERGEDTKKEQEDKESSQSSSVKETMYTVKDKVVGGAKSAIGSLTGNEDLKNEGERQKDQGFDTAQGLTDELSADIHMKKGKVFEEMGAKTESKDMIKDGKQMQKEARLEKEWQGTHDKIAGFATGKEDMKQEGHFQRERGEATK